MTSRILPFFCSAALVLTTVSSSHAAILLFDFGGTGAMAPSPFNNITPATLSLLNTIDTTEVNTGIAITASGFNTATTNADGPRIPAAAPYPAPTGAAAIFASLATTDSMIGNNSGFGTPFETAVITFSGLDLNTRYTFDFLAARCNVVGTIDIRETQFSVAGLVTSDVFLDATNNSSNIATVNSMAPTPAGTITITVDAGPNNTNGNKFFYLNAMRVTTAPVPEPSATLLAGLGAAIAFRRRRAVS